MHVQRPAQCDQTLPISSLFSFSVVLLTILYGERQPSHSKWNMSDERSAVDVNETKEEEGGQRNGSRVGNVATGLRALSDYGPETKSSHVV